MSDVVLALQSIDLQPQMEVDSAFRRWYPELKQIAHARLQRTGLRGSVQTTSLVHDSYLRLAERGELQFATRLQFLAYASRTLRSLIIDQVREQRAQRRGGDLDLVTLDTVMSAGLRPDLDIERVNSSLESLAALDPALMRLVELRFFGGLSALEIADLTGSSERTVQREWTKARALLLTLLEPA
jgi:RNA polymerase sigma factor (TIGR02999 family)